MKNAFVSLQTRVMYQRDITQSCFSSLTLFPTKVKTLEVSIHPALPAGEPETIDFTKGVCVFGNKNMRNLLVSRGLHLMAIR